MRIKQISVKNLFGTFDHLIPLNLDQRITIIHGPNGFGKSTLLKMLDGFLKSRYYDLKTVPFDEFTIIFENDTYIKVAKRENHPDLAQIFYCADGQEKNDQLNFEESLNFSSQELFEIERLIPELRQVRTNHWVDMSSGDMLTLRDVVSRYGDELPFQTNMSQEPKELRELKASVDVHLIGTQRLESYASHGMTRTIFSNNSSRTQAVTKYSEELAEAIEAKLAEYATLSQSLDRTFPTRLIQRPDQEILTEKEIDQALSELEKRRSELREVGLLKKEEDIEIPIPSEIDRTTRNVLSVYIEDIDKKLSVLDEIANKIKLLQEIVNYRFKYKQISVSKQKGFMFTTADQKFLPPTALSSGEQHTLVVLYELLFKVKPGSMILIDEPELSLHVEWQVNFLSELQRITQLASLDVLMATHSPDIISDRWDLTVELKGRAK